MIYTVLIRQDIMSNNLYLVFLTKNLNSCWWTKIFLWP